MIPSASADRESINRHLADYLWAKRELIIAEWMHRVRGDSTIPTDTLTTAQLKDHLPQLLDDLSEKLRSYRSTALAQQIEADAEKHGETRWEQGYDLREMLREIKHLRHVLIHHRHLFEEIHPDFQFDSRLYASLTMHDFLDDCTISASEQFLKA